MSIKEIPLYLEEVRKNQSNPFKRKLTWSRVRCKLCSDVVLGKPVSSEKDWKTCQQHLKNHGIIVDDGIPVRLFSAARFGRWFRQQLKLNKKLIVVDSEAKQSRKDET